MRDSGISKYPHIHIELEVTDEYNEIKMILDLYEKIDISEYLNESECEYLQDDMRWLSEYYMKVLT